MQLIPVYSWSKSLKSLQYMNQSFARKPYAQGLILGICVIIAMLLANLPFTSEWYHNFLNTTFHLALDSPNGSEIRFPRDLTIESFINDVLMTIFFFTVGLEIRRELSIGELSSVKKALLPAIAAFGGVAAPAIIFACINTGTAAASGWGIPTATDIAFVVCILSIFGDRVPLSLKVFLTALAIVDDLIAILVVAIFYGGAINILPLIAAFVVILVAVLIRKLGEKNMFPYLALAIMVWTLFYYSGIHSTMSGVVMAFLIPSTQKYRKAYFDRKIRQGTSFINAEEEKRTTDFPNGPQRVYLRQIADASYGTIGMAKRLEHILTPWVNFLIMPLFALANAGVKIDDISYLNVFTHSEVLGSVGMGIFFGLLIGKPLGITLSSWIAIKLKIAEKPQNSTWPMFIAVACLGGIGFTMSIFVDTLSFGNQLPEVTEHLRSAGKIAVLIGSITAGALGSVLISMFSKHQAKKRK